MSVELRSGGTMQFEIDEAIFEQVEELLDAGLSGAELCKAWLGEALPLGGARSINVAGHRPDGSHVELSIDCSQGKADSGASGRRRA